MKKHVPRPLERALHPGDLIVLDDEISLVIEELDNNRCKCAFLGPRGRNLTIGITAGVWYPDRERLVT